MIRKLSAVAVGFGCLLSAVGPVEAQNTVPDRGIYAPLEVIRGAQVPPPNAPIWGDARLEIPAHNYAVPAGARALYAAPDGRDDAPGTLAAPMSAQAALKAATAGSFVVFRGGIYRVGKLSVSKPVTLQAYRDEKPWFKGSVAVPYVAGEWKTEEFQGRTLYFRDNWNYDLGAAGAAHFIDGPLSKDGKRQLDGSKNALALQRNQVFLDGKMLREVADFSWDYLDRTSGERKVGTRTAREQLLPPDKDPNAPDARQPNGTSWVDDKTKRLYLSVNPAGHILEAATVAEGLFIGGDEAITLRGLGFAQFGEQAVTCRNVGATIENSAFVWNGRYGLFAGGPTQHPTFRGSIFACNGNGGLRVHGANNTLIEGNTLAWNNVKRFTGDVDADGSKMTLMNDLIVRHNIFEGNYATGLWLDAGVDNARVYDNIARSNSGFGIFFEISKGALIAFNVCHDNAGHGIAVSGSTDAQVWNNTLVRNSGAIFVKFPGRKNSDKNEVAGIAPGAVFLVEGNTFHNNLYVDYKPGKSGSLVSARSTNVTSTQMVKSSGSNAFVRTDTDASKRPNAFDWATVGGQNAATTPVATLAEFLADPLNAGYEANSLWLDGPQALFINDARGDFHLKPNAAVAGKGSALPPEVEAIAKELKRDAASLNIGAF